MMYCLLGLVTYIKNYRQGYSNLVFLRNYLSRRRWHFFGSISGIIIVEIDWWGITSFRTSINFFYTCYCKITFCSQNFSLKFGISKSILEQLHAVFIQSFL